MAKFQNCIDFVLANEGGYFEDKATGEESNFGITKKLLEAIDYFTKEPKELTINDAKNIYFQQFWNRYRLDTFTSDKIAYKIFDMYVNMGPREATFVVQRALGLGPDLMDGIMGHFTREEVNEGNETEILGKIVEEQKKAYFKIATGDRAKFLSGWLARAEKV